MRSLVVCEVWKDSSQPMVTQDEAAELAYLWIEGALKNVGKPIKITKDATVPEVDKVNHAKYNKNSQIVAVCVDYDDEDGDLGVFPPDWLQLRLMQQKTEGIKFEYMTNTEETPYL